jgi:hypothetical protein
MNARAARYVTPLSESIAATAQRTTRAATIPRRVAFELYVDVRAGPQRTAGFNQCPAAAQIDDDQPVAGSNAGP